MSSSILSVSSFNISSTKVRLIIRQTPLYNCSSCVRHYKLIQPIQHVHWCCCPASLKEKTLRWEGNNKGYPSGSACHYRLWRGDVWVHSLVSELFFIQVSSGSIKSRKTRFLCTSHTLLMVSSIELSINPYRTLKCPKIYLQQKIFYKLIKFKSVTFCSND